MSTIQGLPVNEIKKSHPFFSDFRSIIETAFYGNHVQKVSTVAEAYELAKQAEGTIVTDLSVYQPEKLGIPQEGKILVANDGKIVGRTASARRIVGQPGVDKTYYSGILREAVYQGSRKQFYHGEVVVGLHESFMAQAHLLIPEGFEMNLYSYLLNFQILNETYSKLYSQSKAFDEGDLYIYADPSWSHPDFPQGLAFFDPEHNVAAILGLRYFGELKKATLTLAWGMAHRNGFTACHGGMKQYSLMNRKYTMAAFGLSGSGKSTITLAEHKHQYDVAVLHDDAFIISREDGSTLALEPAYFDKTQDYATDDIAVQYFLTCQNVGITLDDKGRKVLVNEDIRNGNGRTVKSRLATKNRVDHLGEKLDAIYWIMKDESLPPLIRINDPVLATVFGATLATKRSSAENLAPNANLDHLVIEPFANPFRSYPLGEDYQDFRSLFAEKGTACYILNTGFFNGKKVTPHDTLSCIESLVEEQAVFKAFGPLTAISYLPLANFQPDFVNADYLNTLKKNMETRLAFIKQKNEENAGYDALPEEAYSAIHEILRILENN